MNYVTIATLIAFASYLFYIGIIPSISDSYRTLNDKRFYFLFFFVVAVLIWLQNIYAREALHIPYMLAGYFFFCISLAASFWLKPEGLLHVLFTYSAITVGMLCTVLQLWAKYGLLSLLPVVVLIGGGLLLRNKKNATYWQEVLSIGCIFVPLIFKL